MNELQVLRETVVLNKPFKIYGDEENPVFLAKDVAEWIGHQDVSTMIRGVDEDEIILRSIGGVLSAGNPNKTFLTVNGMYEVLFQSRLPLAKEFKKQVKAVLEEIRKTGSYGMPKIVTPPPANLVTSVNRSVSLKILSPGLAQSIILAACNKKEKGVAKTDTPVQAPILPAVPTLDTFLSLPEFFGWREKLDENPGCFEKMGVKVIRKAGREKLAIDHNHKILLRAAGRDYKARLKTDPRYLETRQVHIARGQVSALIFGWRAVKGVE